ncbi:MAG: ArsC/Spx/MgsR family protein [Bacteroidota bacterium]
MEKRIFHLETCSTCKRIIKELDIDGKGFELQNIKAKKITPEQIDRMHELTGSYEALFSRRAMKFRSMGLKDKVLSEADYRQLILDEYTFLKRPVVLIGDQIFIGSIKKNVEAAKQLIHAE